MQLRIGGTRSGPTDGRSRGAISGCPCPKRAKAVDSPPAMEIDTGKKYTAVFELAKGEEFEIELFADKAPKTVNNFVFLAGRASTTE